MNLVTRRVFRIAIEMIAALFAGIALLAGFVIWQLSDGPVSVDFLTEEIERAINAGDSPVRLDVKDTVLSWGGWDQALDIVVRDVVLSDTKNRKIASLPEVTVELAISGLLKGNVSPTKVEFSDPVLYARRTPQDKIQIFIPEKEIEAQILEGGFLDPKSVTHQSLEMDVEASLRGLVDTLIDLENLEHSNLALKELKSILIVNGKLILDDYKNQRRWQLDQFLASLVRGKTQTILDVSGKIHSGEKNANIEFSLFHPIAKPELQFDLQLNEIDGETLIYALPTLQPYVEALPKSNVQFAGDFDLTSETATLSGKIETSAGKVNFGLDANIKTDELIGVIDSDALSTKIIQSYGTALKPLEAVDADLSFNINLDMILSLQRLRKAKIELKTKEGIIHLPQFFPKDLSIEGMSLSSIIEENGTIIKISDVQIKIPEATIRASATATKKNLDDLSSIYELNLHTIGTDFKMQYLDKYWPPSLGVDARDWVVGNIPVGDIPEVSMTLDAELDIISGAFNLIDVIGDIDIKNADVYYLRPLPHSVRSIGHARFGPDWFDIDIEAGNVGGIRTEGGKIKFSELGTKDRAHIQLPVIGPIEQGLAILDMEPLKLISKLGLPAVEINGIADGVLTFDFELSKKLSIEDVDVDVKATLTNLTLEGIIPDTKLSSNEMNLDLSQDGMFVTGAMHSGEYKADVSWFENFLEQGDLRRKLDMSGSLDDNLLIDKGIDISPYMSGGFSFETHIESFKGGANNIFGTINLSESTLTLSDINWEKPSAIPASLVFEVKVDDEKDVGIKKVTFASDGFDLALSGVLENGTYDPIKIDILHLKKEDGDINVQINWAENGDVNLKAIGKKFDATGILDRLSSNETDNFDQVENPTIQQPSLRVELDIDEVVSLPAMKLKNLNLIAEHTGVKLSRLDVTANLSNGEALSASYNITPNAANQNLEVTTTDLGQALHDLDLFNDMEGGQLTVGAVMEEGSDTLVGTMEVGPYKLTKAPIIGRVLEAISITGLPSALAGTELDFNTLVGGFRLNDKKFILERMKTYNRSVGLTTEGYYDFEKDQIRGEGTAVPAYGLNQAIGAIPVLGWLLTGGDGGGLFGAKFYVTGTREDPDVTVNPASLLTPGALRRIFDLSPNSDGKTIMRSRKEIEENPLPKNNPISAE